MDDVQIECICNQKIKSFKDYKLAILEEITGEIDIFCPNESCSVRELGYIKFKNENGTTSFLKAKFYPTFVSYNVSTRDDESYLLMKSHLIDIVKKSIDWTELSKNLI
jgi:hypothetical protein